MLPSQIFNTSTNQRTKDMKVCAKPAGEQESAVFAPSSPTLADLAGPQAAEIEADRGLFAEVLAAGEPASEVEVEAEPAQEPDPTPPDPPAEGRPELPDYIRAWQDKKHCMEEEIADLSMQAEEAKAEGKEIRERMKELTKQLRAHITRGAVPPPPPPPPGQDNSPGSPNQPAGDEPWRATRLADVPGITEKLAELLEGHDLRTIGDWVDMPKTRGIEYTQLKGVTEKRFLKISEALDAVVTQ